MCLFLYVTLLRVQYAVCDMPCMTWNIYVRGGVLSLPSCAYDSDTNETIAGRVFISAANYYYYFPDENQLR
jgi:hypothetical protein